MRRRRISGKDSRFQHLSSGSLSLQVCGIVAPQVHAVRHSRHAPLKHGRGGLRRGHAPLCIRVLFPVAIAQRVAGQEGIIDLPQAVDVALQGESQETGSDMVA